MEPEWALSALCPYPAYSIALIFEDIQVLDMMGFGVSFRGRSWWASCLAGLLMFEGKLRIVLA